MAPPGERPDEPADAYIFSYPPGAASQPSLAIVEAVAWIRDVPVDELEPLQCAVTAEALNRCFGERSRTAPRFRSSARSSPPDLTVSFDYEGLRVTVTPGEIRIEHA